MRPPVPRKRSTHQFPIAWLVAVLVAVCTEHLCAENWPQWRGPFLNGSTTETGLPTRWSETGNLAWKIPMPGYTASTPIVWGERVFTNTADDTTNGLLAMCIDLRTGKVLWAKEMGQNRKFLGGRHNASSPSPVTDGQHVWFMYGTGRLVALDFEGNQVWSRELVKDYGRFIIKWGYGASPLLYRGRLYVSVLQNKKPGRYDRKHTREKDTRTGKLESFLLAIDAKTGKTIWRHVRPLPDNVTDESTESYATPMRYEGDGRHEIILHAGEHVTSHDAETGNELWRWQFAPHQRIAWQRTVSPVTTGDGMIYFGRPRWQWTYGLSPGGVTGLLYDDIMTWRVKEKPNDVTGPLLYRGRLYILSGKHKTMMCLHPKTGDIIWTERFGKTDFHSSPTGADGKIYCMGMDGTVYVMAAGDKFELLAQMELKEKNCYSTIVAAQSRLLVRTPKYLYCVAKSRK